MIAGQRFTLSPAVPCGPLGFLRRSMTDEKQKLIKELCNKIGELRAVVQQSLDQMGELVTRLEFLRADENDSGIH